MKIHPLIIKIYVIMFAIIVAGQIISYLPTYKDQATLNCTQAYDKWLPECEKTQLHGWQGTLAAAVVMLGILWYLSFALILINEYFIEKRKT